MAQGLQTPVLPSVADGVEHKLDPRSVTVDRLSMAIASAVMGGLSLIAALIVSVAAPIGAPGRLAIFAGWIAIVGFLAGFSLIWPDIRYRHTSYSISDQ